MPFYAGLTLDEIGGQGVRWQERDAAAALPAAEPPGGELEVPPAPADGLTLGTFPSLWSGPETAHSGVLSVLAPRQRAELSPADARRLEVSSGDEVEVAVDDRRVRAVAAVRDAMPSGSVFLVAGTAEHNATALANGAPRVVEVRKVASRALPQAGDGRPSGPTPEIEARAL